MAPLISNKNLYPIDVAITPNDYIIGTDGDNFKKTRNYSVASLINIVNSANSNGVVSGDIIYSENSQTYVITNLSYWLGGSFFTAPGDIEVTLDPSEPTLRRIDAIYVLVDNVVEVKKGIPSDNPASPILNPDQLLLSEVLLIPYNNETRVVGGVVIYLGSGLNYRVTPIRLQYLGISYQIPSADFNLSNGDDFNNRFDVFILNLDTQVIEVIEGTPSENPQIPYYNKNTQYLLSLLLIEALSFEPPVLNTMVYNENLQIAGDEWNTSSNIVDTGIVDFDFSGIADNGSKAIFYRTDQNEDISQLVFDATQDVLTNNISSLFMRYTAFGTSSSGTYNLFVELLDANDNVVSSIIDLYDVPGLTFIADAVFDTIAVPFNLFNAVSFRKIRITSSQIFTPIILDNIQLVYGIPTIPQSSNTYLGLGDTEDTTFLGKENYVPIVKNQKLKLVPSNEALGSTKQAFIASAEQTVFNITAAPNNVSLVFVGEIRANESSYTYANGVLTFSEGIIIGTEVTVIWGGINPNTNITNETNKTILLDTSLDSFTGTLVDTLETVKNYIIPANTIIDGDLLRITAKFNRLTGTSNPGLTLNAPNGTFVNRVSNLVLDRQVVFKNGNFYRFNTSGAFPQDLNTSAGLINFTSNIWNTAINNTINLQLQFEQIAIPEFQLMFLSIERIRIPQ